MPVIPAANPSDVASQDAAEDVDAEVVKQDDVLVGERFVGVEDVSLDEHGPGARKTRPLPTPQTPTQAQIARHNLTHLPYQSWCPFCVACRRKNSHNRKSHKHEREIPLVVGTMLSPRQPMMLKDRQCWCSRSTHSSWSSLVW